MKIIKDLIDGKHPEKFMIVRMKDGTEYVESAFTHPGHPHYMLTPRCQFKDRFRLETKRSVSHSGDVLRAPWSASAIWRTYEDASGLPALLF